MIWGDLMGEADRRGRPRAAVDAQVAATARQHDLTLVTRNTADFAGLGVRPLNPWDDR
jgi:predicted nucleic acid-binding protein